MMKCLAMALLLLINQMAYGQVIDSTLNTSSLKQNYEAALRYLTEIQVKKAIENKEFMGEWPTVMEMHRTYFLLGLKGEYRDSNCFTTAGIFNILAEIYLKDTTQKEILPLLQNAFPEILSYATTNKFNFWKKLPPNQGLQWGREPNPVPKVRRPTHFKLKGRFVNNAANIANDADDSAAGNLAMLLYQKIFQNINDSIKIATSALFDTYIDQNRKNYHWYNYFFKIPRNSSAYLTWLADEPQYKDWNILKSVVNNLLFFTSLSKTYPNPYKAYIPWGANDMDAVVNANILNYLTIKGELSNGKGVLGGNNLIVFQAQKAHWSRAGIYYPNRYHFHYAVSRTYLAGDTGLKSAAKLILTHLLNSQAKDGSFVSRSRVNHTDKIQSTTYALLAMLNLKEMKFDVSEHKIEKAIDYLLQHKIEEGNKVYWKGGVYFSGGTVVRNALYFKSDAYTTALIMQCLQKYLKIKSET